MPYSYDPTTLAVMRSWTQDNPDITADEEARGYVVVEDTIADPTRHNVNLSGGTPVLVSRPATAPDMEIVRHTNLTRIDMVAEAVRTQSITTGSGQAMTYTQKLLRAEEVLAIADAGDIPDAADFPLLSHEIGVTAPTLVEVAHIIVANAAAWETVAGRIEGARLTGKQAVMAAIDADTAQCACDDTVAALNAIAVAL